MPHRRSPRAASFVPRLEALEDRCLLAATVTASADGTLLIHGGAENDRVRIFDNGTNNVNNVVVAVNNQMVAPDVAVSHITVKTGAGDDTVTYNLNAALATGTARVLFVDLGPGRNTFGARLRGGLLARSGLTLNVKGGNGLDNISVQATGNVTIAAGATLTMRLTGGTAGPDTITANYNGQLVGNINLFAEGGNGDDLFSSQMILTPGSTGNISAQMFGEGGNDKFLLNVRKITLTDRATVGAVIDGGTGFNEAAASAGVIFQHVRRKTHL
jgi:hypothetical protein